MTPELRDLISRTGRSARCTPALFYYSLLAPGPIILLLIGWSGAILLGLVESPEPSATPVEAAVAVLAMAAMGIFWARTFIPYREAERLRKELLKLDLSDESYLRSEGHLRLQIHKGASVIFEIDGRLLAVQDIAFPRIGEGWRTVDHLKHSGVVLEVRGADGEQLYRNTGDNEHWTRSGAVVLEGALQQ